MQSIHKKHIGIISFFVIVVIGFLIVLNTFFDIQFVGNIFSRFVTIQASVIVLMVLALIHFLFITNLLHTSHREHSAVLSNITEGLVVLDAHKKITMMNVAAQEILGISLADATHKAWDDITRIESHDTDVLIDGKPLIDSVFLNQKIYSKEWYVKKRDGTSVPVAISISPIIDRAIVVGGIIVFRNIEQEKEIDTVKSEFISLVSHQLRTPLSAVNWCTESLLAGDRGKVNNKQKEYIARISESNKRMISLVNSILDVSQIELNTFIIDAKPVDMFALVESIMKESMYAISTKQLMVHKHYTKSLGVIIIDARYVRMIIENLISNAIKYTPEKGSIDITIEERGADLYIAVADTGYGIPKNDLSKVFTKLFRAHNIMNKDTDGNGLGLYIVKSIVDYAGGKIWFESVEDKGTTFFVSLPIHGLKNKLPKAV